ncbi:MAG: hypothetical protein RLZZ535_2021 [Cyanobacteriota bacterium]|jgi:hypothetical protein
MDLSKESEQKHGSISNCYFKTLKLGGLTAKAISRLSGVTEANISKFRKGGGINTYSYERLLNALPVELRKQYYLLMIEGESQKKSDLELDIAERLESSAYQLRQKRTQDN